MPTRTECRDHIRGIQPGEVFVRTFNLVSRQVNENERTVELAFASEEPVARWYGMEILDHSPGAVRLERLNNGGAVLMDHNTRDQVGAVVQGTARVEPDGVARATAKMSRGVRGTEILQDIEDEIRSLVSVGYVWHKWEVIEAGANEPDQIRVTEWEPLEISFVAVPADATVGVGRALEPDGGRAASTVNTPAAVSAVGELSRGALDMPEVIAPAGATSDQVAPELGGDDSRGTGQAEVIDRTPINERITALGAQYDCPELAADYVNLDRSVDEFQAAVAARRSNVYPVPTAPNAPTNRGPRIEQYVRYSKLKHFTSEEDAYRSGMWARAVVFGDPDAARWCKDAQVRVMTAEEFAKGAALVPNEMSQAIIDLREQYGVARQIARNIPMGGEAMDVPRRTGGVTAYFAGQKVATTESDQAWDQVGLVARELSALTRISAALAEDAVIDLAQDLVVDMARAFAKKEDECMIDGDGTSTYGGIVGLRTKIIDGTHTASAIDASSGDDTIPEIDSADLVSVAAALPEFAEDGASWLCSKAFRVSVFDTIAAAAGGNTMEMIAGAPRRAYLGDPIVTSAAMPKGIATDYSDVAMAFYGNFSQGIAFGDRRGFAMQILRERYAEFRQIGVIGFERFDLNVHDLGDNTDAGPIIGLIGE